MLKNNFPKIAKMVSALLISTGVIFFGILFLNQRKNNASANTISPLADNSFSVGRSEASVLGLDSGDSNQDEELKSTPTESPKMSDTKTIVNKKEVNLGGNNPKAQTPVNNSVNRSSHEVVDEPSPTPKALYPVEIPSYMVEASQENFDWRKGSITFRFKADWKEGDVRDLLYLNYNGTDRKNLFYVGVSDNVLTFDTYTADLTQEFDELNADIGSDFPGKEFDIELVWDFTASTPFKKLYINGRLDSEQMVVFKPEGTNPKAYIGPITNHVITKE